VTPKVWTHKQLVRRLGSWLKNRRYMTVVITELTTGTSETPDVVGWKCGGCSTLVECKVSRADFKADAKKFFRRNEGRGIGDRRYMATPKGLLTPREVPEGWGLLEVGNHQVREIKPAEYKEANKTAECTMLVSAIRRLEISTAVFVRQAKETP